MISLIHQYYVRYGTNYGSDFGMSCILQTNRKPPDPDLAVNPGATKFSIPAGEGVLIWYRYARKVGS